MRIKYTEKKIQEFINEGRGSGELAFYKPWIITRELTGAASRKSRIKGLLTGRVHHLLSDLEKKIFFLLEWINGIYDIREQFPLLPREDTIKIAEEYGIRYPIYPYTSVPTVMTTDFLVTKISEDQKKEIALCVKYSRDLDNERTLKKIHIEKKYWEKRGKDFWIFTEKDINPIVIRNIMDFRDAIVCNLVNEIDAAVIEQIKNDIQNLIYETRMTVKEAVVYLDTKYRIPEGYSLYIFRHLVAKRIIPIKMDVPFYASKDFSMLIDYTKTTKSKKEIYDTERDIHR
jgi:hypothetical protein